MNIQDVINQDTKDVIEWVTTEYLTNIPISMETAEDIQTAIPLMAVAANNYSYLSGILSYLKYYIRRAKQLGEKELADELIDKKEAVTRTQEAVKLQRDTLSRMLTAKEAADREIQMCGSPQYPRNSK